MASYGGQSESMGFHDHTAICQLLCNYPRRPVLRQYLSNSVSLHQQTSVVSGHQGKYRYLWHRPANQEYCQPKPCYCDRRCPSFHCSGIHWRNRTLLRSVLLLLRSYCPHISRCTYGAWWCDSPRRRLLYQWPSGCHISFVERSVRYSTLATRLQCSRTHYLFPVKHGGSHDRQWSHRSRAANLCRRHEWCSLHSCTRCYTRGLRKRPISTAIRRAMRQWKSKWRCRQSLLKLLQMYLRTAGFHGWNV